MYYMAYFNTANKLKLKFLNASGKGMPRVNIPLNKQQIAKDYY